MNRCGFEWKCEFILVPLVGYLHVYMYGRFFFFPFRFQMYMCVYIYSDRFWKRKKSIKPAKSMWRLIEDAKCYGNSLSSCLSISFFSFFFPGTFAYVLHIFKILLSHVSPTPLSLHIYIYWARKQIVFLLLVFFFFFSFLVIFILYKKIEATISSKPKKKRKTQFDFEFKQKSKPRQNEPDLSCLIG